MAVGRKRTADEDGEWRGGQGDDQGGAREESVDHPTDALANDGLLHVCTTAEEEVTKGLSAITLTADSARAGGGAFTVSVEDVFFFNGFAEARYECSKRGRKLYFLTFEPG